MKPLFASSALASLVLSVIAGCTTNVENPNVDQTGRTGDTTCIKDCDDTQTTCVAKCSDDTCKAACTTDHDKCTGACAPADGGK